MLPNDDVSQFRFVFHDPLLFEWVGAPCGRLPAADTAAFVNRFHPQKAARPTGSWWLGIPEGLRGAPT